MGIHSYNSVLKLQYRQDVDASSSVDMHAKTVQPVVNSHPDVQRFGQIGT